MSERGTERIERIRMALAEVRPDLRLRHLGDGWFSVLGPNDEVAHLAVWRAAFMADGGATPQCWPCYRDHLFPCEHEVVWV